MTAEQLLTRAEDRLPVAPNGAAPSAAAPLHTLTTKQRALLGLVVDYYRVTGEPCSASYLARRMGVHHSTIQQHLAVLHHKGWLLTAKGPAVPLLTEERRADLG